MFAFGVVHGVELGAGEVPAVEPDEDRLGLGWMGAEEGVELWTRRVAKEGFPEAGTPATAIMRRAVSGAL